MGNVTAGASPRPTIRFFVIHGRRPYHNCQLSIVNCPLKRTCRINWSSSSRVVVFAGPSGGRSLQGNENACRRAACRQGIPKMLNRCVAAAAHLFCRYFCMAKSIYFPGGKFDISASRIRYAINPFSCRSTYRMRSIYRAVKRHIENPEGIYIDYSAEVTVKDRISPVSSFLVI